MTEAMTLANALARRSGRALAARAACAVAALMMAGCATLPPDSVRMAPRCDRTAPILLMATDPAETVIQRGEPGFSPIRTSGESMSMYRWLWLTFDRQTQACLVSPLDFMSAAARLQLDIGTVSAFGRVAAATAASIDHLGFDPQKMPSILAAAAAAGAKFVVVGRWVDGKWASYKLVEVSGTQGEWFSSSRSVEVTTVAGLAKVEVQVFDAPSGALVYRKQYAGLEEVLLSGGSSPSVRIHSPEVRKAISAGVIEDLTRYMMQSPQTADSALKMPRRGMSASRPIELQLQGAGIVAKLDVSLEEIKRSERFTEFRLRFHNLHRDADAQVSLSRTALGPMVIAKATSGQVYLSDDKAGRSPEPLMLRAGEAGLMSFVLRNDLGAMHEIALYVDVDVRVGRASGTRRITFPNLNAP